MSLGDRIFQLKGREKTKDFAERFGISVSQVSRYESGLSQLSIDVAMAMCDYYGCTLDWLLRGVGEFNEEPKRSESVPEQIETVPINEHLELLRKYNKLLEQENEKQAEKLRERSLQ